MPEWAQLRRGPAASTLLEKGHWYGVVDRLDSGAIRVSGPGAVGVMTHVELVRLIDHEPNMITRVHGADFKAERPGEATPMLSFHGVCPKGHRIDRLGIADSLAQCPMCRRSYPVEDEQHV